MRRLQRSQLPSADAASCRRFKLWVGPARAWPIVPDRELNIVYASRTIAKCISKALQALQASQNAGLETWSMYERLAARSQCISPSADLTLLGGH